LNTPDAGTWKRTSPFAILFFLGRIVRLIAKNAWQSLAPLFALLVAYQGDLVTKATIGAVGFGVVIAVASVLSYLFFRFQIRDDSILIRQGVITKKQLDIKYDRIQGINTQQNPVYRWLGLVTVSFDTAGSAGSEGNLPAVTRKFADDLSARINRQKTGETIANIAQQEAPEDLVRLNWRDMIRIGISDRRALIVLAFLGPLFEQLEESTRDLVASRIDSVASSVTQFGIAQGLTVVAFFVIAIALILGIISVAAAFLRFHNFALWLDGNTLRSRGGLLTRHEHSMDLGKIQTLRLEQGIVQRLQNRFKLTARQAISSGRQRSKKIFEIPIVTAELADALRQQLLGPESGRLTQNPRSDRFVAVSPYFMRSRILFIGLIPSVIAAAIVGYVSGAVGLLALLWIPVFSLITYRSWRRAGYLHDDDEIIRRSGLLGFRTVGLLFRKVQRVTISQSRYQRSKNLASLRLYMASGSVRIPYIEHATAKQLRNYILYKVESSRQAWH